MTKIIHIYQDIRTKNRRGALLGSIMSSMLIIALTACSSNQKAIPSVNESFNSSVVSSKAELPQNSWQTIKAQGDVVARHEAGLIDIESKLYLLGGRRINPVNIFDIASNTWEQKSASPLEIHHFQPVVFQGEIYVVGAMTGKYPNEKPLEHILIYSPKTDKWSVGDEIPLKRRRGGAGALVYNNKIYLSGGITDGHRTGTVAWFDEYNPNTGTWRILDDMPNGRDHFQIALVGNKLFAAGGRRTSQITNEVFNLVINKLDIYDFSSQTWSTEKSPLPTPRAGNITTAVAGQVWVIGGESMVHELAHNDVEIYNIHTKQWLKGPDLNRGRHGTGAAFINNSVWIASGSGNRGGKPELNSIEKLTLKK